jgi:hypothetical protein
MRTVHHEWDYEPEPRHHREPRIALIDLEFTIERSKPSLTTRVEDAYFRATMFAIKIVACAVLMGVIAASVWVLAALIKISIG